MEARTVALALALTTGCAGSSTEQLIALETWSSWSPERAEMTFAGGKARLVDRRADPVLRWQGRLTDAGEDALIALDRFLIEAPIPHDACISAGDGLVLTVRFQVESEEVAANACPSDPSSPYADAWQLYDALAGAMTSCTQGDLVIPSGGCEPYPSLPE